VDLDSLLGRHPGLGGEVGGAEPLGAEACRRLAYDGAVTRVLVIRHLTNHHHDHGSDDGPGGHADPDHDRHDHGLGPDERFGGHHHQDDPGTDGGLRQAVGGGDAAPAGTWWCPDPTAGGGPYQPGGDRRPTGRPGGL
jgi:hypothetical protein